MPFLGSSSLRLLCLDTRYLAVGALVLASATRQELVTCRGEAMRLAVYGAVLAITLGSVLLGLDWLSAPMSPMVNTEAGLRAPVASLPPPIAKTGASNLAPPVAMQPPTPSSAKAGAPNIGARIVPPSLTAPTSPNAPASAGAAVDPTPAPIAAPEPAALCNVEACTAAYRSFRASDCTYIASGGARRLCAK